MDGSGRTPGHIAVRHGPGITLLSGSRVGCATPRICRPASKEQDGSRCPMSRRGIAIIVGVVVAGAVLLLGARVAIDRNGAPGRAATGTGSFSARTAWGEPDLTGVWKGVPLGASSGRDTFNLAKLEELYTPEARARMKELSAKDDPTMRCAPPAFPRAAMLGYPVQIVQRPGFAFVFTEAYPVFRIIPTSARPHTSKQYLFPTYMGDSTARWEGDTLVVDVMSFNDEGWLASPADKPTSASTGAVSYTHL